MYIHSRLLHHKVLARQWIRPFHYFLIIVELNSDNHQQIAATKKESSSTNKKTLFIGTFTPFTGNALLSQPPSVAENHFSAESCFAIFADGAQEAGLSLPRNVKSWNVAVVIALIFKLGRWRNLSRTQNSIAGQITIIRYEKDRWQSLAAEQQHQHPVHISAGRPKSKWKYKIKAHEGNII